MNSVTRIRTAYLPTGRVRRAIALAVAWGAVVGWHAAGRIARFRTLDRWAGRLAPPVRDSAHPTDLPDLSHLSRARTAAALLRRAAAWPLARRATCASRALALRWLLRWLGQPAVVVIGVRSDAVGGYLGHAWVEVQGTSLASREEEVERYVRLPALHSHAHGPRGAA